MKDKSICLYHRVMRRENFEVAANDLFKLLLSAQKTYPNKTRVLYLDIDGHRNFQQEDSMKICLNCRGSLEWIFYFSILQRYIFH